MEMLRDKHKGLEQRIVEMIRHGQENVAISDKLHKWTRAIMLTTNPGDLPSVLVNELKHEFQIPQAGIRVWGAAEAFGMLGFAKSVGDDAKSFASSLTHAVLGVNRLRSRVVAGRFAPGGVDGAHPVAPW